MMLRIKLSVVVLFFQSFSQYLFLLPCLHYVTLYPNVALTSKMRAYCRCMCLLSCCTFLCTLFFRKVRLRNVGFFVCAAVSRHATFLRRFVSTFAWRVFCEAVLADAVCPIRRCGTTPHVLWKKKAAYFAFVACAAKVKTGGSTGGSGGDPGGIRVQKGGSASSTSFQNK